MALSFVITNTTGSSVGPYNGNTILANGTLTVTPPFSPFTCDATLLGDVLSLVVTITVGAQVLPWNIAFQYLQSINLQSAITDSNNNLQTVGNVASGATDSGNPLKTGGVYNGANLPTPTSGQRYAFQINQFAELSVQYRNKFLNVTGNATALVKTGSGRLHGISINNNSTGGVFKFYDNTAGSGTVIATFAAGSPSGGLLSSTGQPGPSYIGPLGLEFSTGLTVVTSSSTANNITVLYQ